MDDFVIREAATIILEDNFELASNVPILAEVVEGVHLPFAAVGAEWSVAMASHNLRQDGSLNSQLANDAPSPADGRGKGVADDGYETGFDLDADEMRMMEEGFTQLKVRLEGSTRTIAIPMDRDLLKVMENMVLALGPLCFNVEDKTLQELDDVTLSRSIADLTLRTVDLEFKSTRREERCKAIFMKL
ncbi:uncharacterized protein [Nicotiana sylvestris]|uniref:Uncharacterized protein LOC104212936 n=1 Tax=Nicotiana sylvestris TaxID=4096 RepID=A0A1U7UX51_NICSY|nr:PREDICTED: uncharacterized protein LOC104212936 [Nicotiana sylvestris]